MDLTLRDDGGAADGGLAEIIDMVERAYFDALPFDLSAFSLARFEMEEVAMDQRGDVEVRSTLSPVDGPTMIQ